MKADHFDLETEESAIRMHQDALKQANVEALKNMGVGRSAG